MAREGTLQRLQRGTHGAGGEILDWSYYDTAALDPAVNVYPMFTVQKSAAKPLNQTNMTLGGQIPNGQRMTVRHIKAFYISAVAHATADVQSLYSFLDNSTMEIFIPGKDSLLTVTLAELMGAATLFALTPTVAGDNIPLMQPRYHGIFPLNSPIILAGQTSFEVRVTTWVAVAVALKGDMWMLSLNGKLERAS